VELGVFSRIVFGPEFEGETTFGEVDVLQFVQAEDE
jgi:hypothetical protein